MNQVTTFSRAEVEGTLLPVEDASWLPQRAYIDQEVFRSELDQIFFKEWLPVFHQSALPDVGDFRTIEIAGRPLLFTRNNDGTIRCFNNICRHRGMAVAEGEGNCKLFICPYHRWTYDIDGKLKQAPLIKGKWEKGTVGLTEVRTEIFLGLVFINFQGDDAPPVAEGLTGLAEALAPWNPDQMEVGFELGYDCQWNWKLMFENGIEAYHILGTHRESIQAMLPAERGYVTTPDDTDRYDILHTPYNEYFTAPEGVDDVAVYPPNLPEWAEREARFFNLRPGTVIWNNAANLVVSLILPRSVPGECHVVHMELVAPATKQHPEYEAWKEKESAFIDLIQEEDTVPCTRIQRTYEGSSGWIPGPYEPKTERACWNFHQWYLGKLGVAA